MTAELLEESCVRAFSFYAKESIKLAANEAAQNAYNSIKMKKRSKKAWKEIECWSLGRDNYFVLIVSKICTIVFVAFALEMESYVDAIFAKRVW